METLQNYLNANTMKLAKTEKSHMNAKVRRMARIAIEYGSALIFGIILYKLCRPYAVSWRNSTAIGGEIALLGFPVWYGMAKSVIRDLVYTVRKGGQPC